MEIELGTASISKNQIQIKLHQKYAELKNIDTKEVISTSQNKDYIEQNLFQVDKNDYERVLDKFKTMDSNTRAHEQLHASLGGGSITYSYQIGPDGKMYANGGYVRIDTSIPNDPKEAQFKLDKIKKAAASSSDLSAADSSIATSANIMKIRLSIQEQDNNKNSI